MIVVQVAITVALLPLAPVLVVASNRFGQRAEAVGADRYLTATIAVRPPGPRADSAAPLANARASLNSSGVSAPSRASSRWRSPTGFP